MILPTLTNTYKCRDCAINESRASVFRLDTIRTAMKASKSHSLIPSKSEKCFGRLTEVPGSANEGFGRSETQIQLACHPRTGFGRVAGQRGVNRHISETLCVAFETRLLRVVASSVNAI